MGHPHQKKRNLYIRAFFEGKMDGEGEMHWPQDRKVYKGQFKDDKREGYGVLSWKDGRVYEGEWKQNLQHGQGRMKDTQGQWKSGRWEDGRLRQE